MTLQVESPIWPKKRVRQTIQWLFGLLAASCPRLVSQMSDFQDQVTVHLKYSRPAMLDSGSEAAHDCTIVIATTLENTYINIFMYL